MTVRRLFLAALALVSGCSGFGKEGASESFAIEIDAAQFRYRLVAQVAGEDVRYDARALRTMAGVPVGAAISIRDRAGKIIAARYTPLLYSSLKIEPPSYQGVKTPGPVSEWYPMAALFRRCAEYVSPRPSADWSEFKIEFALGADQAVQSRWFRIDPAALQRFVAAP